MSRERRGIRLVTIIFSLFCTLFLLIGGSWLVFIGGSSYYLIAGLAMLLFTLLVIKRQPGALYIYAIVLLATAIWAYNEVGFDFWSLAPRIDIWGLFGLWMVLPFVYRQLCSVGRGPLMAMFVALAINAALMAIPLFVDDPQEINGTLEVDNKPLAVPSVAAEDWPAYGRTQEGVRYSPLSQINESNVKTLQPAWVYQSGDVQRSDDPGEITNEATPLKVGNTLYTCTAHQILLALDAVTGKERWRFDPKLKYNSSFQHLTCRGVSYAEVKSAPAECSKRILLPVNDGHLFAIDAESGQICRNFADNGVLDLQEKQPYAYAGGYEPTSPPIITDKVIIIAGSVTDNLSIHEPSGVIRGFDVETGKLIWAFDPGAKDPNHIPGPGEHFSHNSPNSWAPAAYDAKLDIVYLPIGVSTPDIWGGNRTPEQERYATGILALHAATGKLAWFFQTVHHDLWDMDVPAQPTLVDLRDNNGETVPAIYAPAKTGDIFVLNRVTGKPIIPADEHLVPGGPAQGDHLSKTQPYSELSYRPTQMLTDKNMWGSTMFDQLVCRVMFHRLRYEGPFTPPSVKGTLVFPGNLGMFEWGGISVNTDKQFAITNPMALGFISKLVPRGPNNPIEPDESGAKGSGSESGIQHMYGVPFGVELNPFLSPFGLPCMAPSWGFVSALDLKTHEVIWKKRIGTVRDSAPVPFPFKMGVPMLGAPITTAGNIFFIAATLDDYLRAYSVKTGELLWQARLPAGGQATPMTYSVDGKQYVVVTAGGHGSFGSKMGDYIVAYKLPDAH